MAGSYVPKEQEGEFHFGGDKPQRSKVQGRRPQAQAQAHAQAPSPSPRSEAL